MTKNHRQDSPTKKTWPSLPAFIRSQTSRNHRRFVSDSRTNIFLMGEAKLLELRLED